MSIDSRDSDVYSWGDTLSLVREDLSCLQRASRMALAVGPDQGERARDALTRGGWSVHSLQEMAGRSGILIRARKA